MNQLLEEPITAEAVEQFLQAHPDFFLDRQALVDRLSLPHVHQGAVSLVELQMKRQRERMQALEAEHAALIKVVSRNDKTFRHFMSLEEQILKANSGEQVIAALRHKAEEMGLRVHVGIIGASFAHLPVDTDHWRRFQSQFMTSRRAYLGRLKRSARELLFGDDISAPELGSYAVIAFEHCTLQGFVCFYSDDGGRFEPSQDTLYLSHLVLIIAHQLAHLEWKRVPTLHVQPQP